MSKLFNLVKSEQASKWAMEGVRLGWAKQMERSGKGVSDMERAPNPFALLLIFGARSHFRFFRVLFWKKKENVCYAGRLQMSRFIFSIREAP